MLKLVVNNVKKELDVDVEVEIDPNSYYPFPPSYITKQTYAAYGVSGELLYSHNPDFSFKKMMWFPKSQLLEWRAPGWLFIAKAKEMRDIMLEEEVTLEKLERQEIMLSEFCIVIAGTRINMDAVCLD